MLPAGDRAGSFPSNHASKAEVYSMLVSRNIDSLPVSNVNKTALKIGTFGLDLGTAWARVEGKRHFSSDVFAGMALGHFLGAFFNDAFLGLGHPGDGGIFFDWIQSDFDDSLLGAKPRPSISPTYGSERTKS
jgi:membrane-associated phospholipid phosphatase